MGVRLDCTSGGRPGQAVGLGGETWRTAPSGKALESRLQADAFAGSSPQSVGYIRPAAAGPYLCGQDFGKAWPGLWKGVACLTSFLSISLNRNIHTLVSISWFLSFLCYCAWQNYEKES